MNTRNVVVIGGGLAGITAAIALREAGVDVTLLEARPWLGGAACSFSRGELTIDNGQHVFLRCCTSYQGTAGPARRDRLGGGPGPLRRHRAVAGRPGPAAPQRAAQPAAPRPGPGRLPVPLRARAAAGRPGRAGHAHPRPGQAGPGQPAARRLAARAGAERAGPPEPLGPVHRVLAEHRTATTPACRWRRPCSRPRCSAATTRPTSASRRCRSASCTARPRPACWPGSAPRCGWAPRRPRSSAAPPAGSRSGSPRAGMPRTAPDSAGPGDHDQRRRRRAGGPVGPGRPAGRRGGRDRRGPAGTTSGYVADRQRARGLRPPGHGCRSRRRWTRRCSGCSTRPGRPACSPGSTWRSRCPPRTSYVDVPTAALREQFLPALEELFPAAAEARVTDSSSPGSAGRRSGRRRDASRCAPVPRPRCRGWCWPVRGPTPAGRTRWRVLCEADIPLQSS